jgi:hypothetical protein
MSKNKIKIKKLLSKKQFQKRLLKIDSDDDYKTHVFLRFYKILNDP